MIYDPETTLLVYSELGKALSAPLDVLTRFVDKDNNLLQLTYDFKPQDFTRAQRLQLLRHNANLQFCLEKLSAIIELVPYNFRINKVPDPSKV